MRAGACWPISISSELLQKSVQLPLLLIKFFVILEIENPELVSGNLEDKYNRLNLPGKAVKFLLKVAYRGGKVENSEN